MAANAGPPELTLEYIKHEEDGRCVICQYDFSIGEDLQRINVCSHVFHAHCLRKWLHSKDHCPLCRITLPDDGETFIKIERTPSPEVNIDVGSPVDYSQIDFPNFARPERGTQYARPERVTRYARHDPITQSPRPAFNPSAEERPELNTRNSSYRRRLLIFEDLLPVNSSDNTSFASILASENFEGSSGSNSPASIASNQSEDEQLSSDSTESSLSANQD